MKNNLFNEKTIARLCSKVKVTPKQKQTTIEWLKLLESGVLDKETKNYFKFAGYVLEDLLGYSLRIDLEHEEADIEFSFKDSKGQTVLCIEAKGETKDLFTVQKGYKKEQETPFKQTWDNMGRIASIKYGICTNYKDFILIDKSKGYSKYHFFDFLSIKEDEEKLKEFIAIFSKENIIDNEFLEKLYEESVVEEREFTKQFYKLFHETRLVMIKEFQDNGASREESIHFAQIFLNRLMFVFFAKDTGKLDKKIFENLVLGVLRTDNILSDQSKIVSDVIVSLFHRLNEGSESPYPIYGFNGGLFKESIPPKIYFNDFRKKDYFKEIYQYSTLKKEVEQDDDFQIILKKYKGTINPIILNILYMSRFDFKTEVSVNILGHIFEQSISDLEELKEEKILRRKKEGVYYTPDYITDYICRNTIIPYLSEKETNSVDKLINEYKNNIEELEEKFKNLKILDPACGSGSFLIKAVDVLLEIYKEIQMIKQMKGQYTAKKSAALKKRYKRAIQGNLQLTLFKWNEENEARKIIENNIFGVDINEESVEITKLSLFLKIAQKNRKLIDLSNNIKCGNSLIDNFEIAGSKAFNWNEKFKGTIDKNKFNIIVGNPPYVREEHITEIKPYLKKNYVVFDGNADLYVYFFEKSLSLLSENGKLGFISSNKWIKSNYGKNLRNLIINNKINEIIDFGELTVFQDAGTFPCITLLSRTEPKENHKILTCRIFSLNFSGLDQEKQKNCIEVKQTKLKSGDWIFEEENVQNLIDKLFSIKTNLKDYIQNQFLVGIKTGYNEAYIVTPEQVKEIIKNDKKEKELYKPFCMGTEVRRYRIDSISKYLIFPYQKQDGELKLVDINNYPETKKYLEKFKDKLSNRAIIKEGIKDGSKKWYELQQINKKIDFDSSKIIYPDIAITNRFTLDTCGYYIDMTCFLIPKNDLYLLSLLNSKLYRFIFSLICPVLGDVKKRGRIRFKSTYLARAPIKIISNFEQQPCIKKVKNILELNEEFSKKRSTFVSRLQQNLNIKKITNILEDFYYLDFKDFMKELSKQGIEFSLKQQDEWEDYFNQYKEKLLELKKQIEKTDNEIDLMVYKLYDLKDKDIAIVEEHLKKKL